MSNSRYGKFDKFEKDCGPAGKPLHDSMEENCNEHFEPESEVYCDTPCVPYWQKTDNLRCLGNGLIDFEETDGCGHTRWTRGLDKVEWATLGEPGPIEEYDPRENARCNDAGYVELEQENQCGDTRWVTTNGLCCIPDWVNDDYPPDCSKTVIHQAQIDGCGNTRMRSTGDIVSWINTGEARCMPGDIYEIEQENQCGDLRWINSGQGCPCIPEWTATGDTRCQNNIRQNKEEDGCGKSRWVNTSIACDIPQLKGITTPSTPVHPGDEICWTVTSDLPALAGGLQLEVTISGDTTVGDTICASYNGAMNGPLIDTITAVIPAGSKSVTVCYTIPEA